MSRERRKLISIITVISILGVVVGVTALIAVIAVMDGAQEDYFRKLIDQYAHIEVWKMDRWGEPRPIENYQALRSLIEDDPAVVAASPVIKHQRFAILQRDVRGEGGMTGNPTQVLGIDPDLEQRVSTLIPTEGDSLDPEDPDDRKTIQNLRPEEMKPKLWGKRIPDRGEIVIGMALFKGLRVTLGDSVIAMTTKLAQTANSIVPKKKRLRVVGVFQSGLYDVDRMMSYVSLQTAQDMYVLGDEVDMLHAKLEDPYEAPAAQGRMQKALMERFPNEQFIVRTWQQLNPEFFKALALEKLAMFIILLLIVIVAALNIISTLILVTMEKTRQIGILRAMGTPRRSIARIFMIQGVLIGTVGTGLGVALGLIVCWFLETQLPDGLVPEAVYGLDGLPVLVKPVTVLIIVGCSIGISLLASIIPAIQASRLDIVEALRYE